MGAVNEVFGDEGNISRGVDAGRGGDSVDGGDDNGSDRLGSLDEVTVEVVQVKTSQPGVRSIGFGGDGGRVQESDSLGLRELLLDSDKSAPVEGLNEGALRKVMLLQDGDKVGNILLNGESLVGSKGVNLGLV